MKRGPSGKKERKRSVNKKGTQWEEGEKEKCEQKGDPVGRRREREV